MESIGVRELRQNASRYLERVAAGETLEITNHGKPVARLTPPPTRERTWEDLIAEGLVIPAEGDFLEFMLEHPPIKPPPGTPSSQEILDELRAERLP